MLYCVYKVNRPMSQNGGDLMPENIVNILDSIAAVRGQEYVEGLVDMANILAPKAEDDNQPG